jgi:hypothetical protein
MLINMQALSLRLLMRTFLRGFSFDDWSFELASPNSARPAPAAASTFAMLLKANGSSPRVRSDEWGCHRR